MKGGALPFPESEGRLSRASTHAASPAQRLCGCRVQALILSPTRELAAQTTKTILAVGDFAKVSAHTCIGGTSLGAHARPCPGREPQVFAATVSAVVAAHRLLRTRMLGAAGRRLLVSSGSVAVLHKAGVFCVQHVYSVFCHIALLLLPTSCLDQTSCCQAAYKLGQRAAELNFHRSAQQNG